MRWRNVCDLARRLPEVQEGKTYGVRALRVRGSFVARLLDDRTSILVKAGPAQRDALCAARPDAFSVASAEQGSAVGMVVRLRSVDPEALWPVLVESWRLSAPPSLAAGFEPGGPS